MWVTATGRDHNLHWGPERQAHGAATCSHVLYLAFSWKNVYQFYMNKWCT